jgi:hypothetical protein
MKNGYKKNIGITIILVAVFLVWQKQKKESKSDELNITLDSRNFSGRDATTSENRKRVDYMPFRFFDKEPTLNVFRKIEGNGVTVAEHFNHDIQSPKENFGHYMRDKLYKDHNKVEMLVNENDEFLLYRVNYETYITHRNEREARKQLLNRGVGSIRYGNTYMKKYPLACYFQVLHEANRSTNNWPVYYGQSPKKEIEIYPCTFTYDELWSEGGGEYMTHEGFLVISSVGLDYELDANEITKHPVIGKIRRDYQLIGMGVNENAKNERERFDKKTATTGVRIWEDRIQEGK